MNKAIFLDKDGTLVHNVPYNVDSRKIKFYEDAFSSLRVLQSVGFKLFIITNQSGIARGYHTEEAFLEMRDYMTQLLRSKGITISGFYTCPHHIEGLIPKYSRDCDCRKPKSGLLVKAASEHNIDLTSSWMVGDILDDVEAGNKVLCDTILIDNGGENEWESGNYREPTHLASSLKEAAEIILDKESVIHLVLS